MQLKDVNGNIIYPEIDTEEIIGSLEEVVESINGVEIGGGTKNEKLTCTIDNNDIICLLADSSSRNNFIIVYNPYLNDSYKVTLNDLQSLNGVLEFNKGEILIFVSKHYSYCFSLDGYEGMSSIHCVNNKCPNEEKYFILNKKLDHLTSELLINIISIYDDVLNSNTEIILPIDNIIVGYIACLTPDTLITLADGSYKRIDEITYDDIVLGYDIETLELVPQKVIFTDSMVQKSAEEYDVWTLSDGTIIKTVHEHSFYNVEQQKMLHMSEWNIGDHFVKEDGSRPYLVSHKTIKEQTLHYTLGAEQHNFFANGCLSGSHWTKEMHL